MGCALSTGSLKEVRPVFDAFKERGAVRKEHEHGSIWTEIFDGFDLTKVMPLSYLAVGGGTFKINSAVRQAAWAWSCKWEINIGNSAV
jgi:hypothetical protein